MRSFSLKWLEEFGQVGLCYSVYEDAAFCKFCRLLPGGERWGLVEKPFQKWKDAIHYFNAQLCNILSDKTKGYHGNKLHLSAITRIGEFDKCIEEICMKKLKFKFLNRSVPVLSVHKEVVILKEGRYMKVQVPFVNKYLGLV